jgi:hypothetical protein
MGKSGPLDRPADIYRPFTDEEREVLSAYVANVRDLGTMRFYEQIPRNASFTWDGKGAHVDMAEPDPQDLRAAVAAFRQIYTHTEPTSAVRVLNILKRSIRGRNAPRRDEALAALKELREWPGEILDRGIGLGIAFDNGKTAQGIDPRKILDAYFHGQYIHSGNQKTKLAKQLDDLQPWPRYTLYTVMGQLTQAYWVIANVAELALKTPAAVAPS